MAIQSLPACFKPYVEAYEKLVTTKPQVIADIESTVRCLSYFTAGRFGSSSLTSELIYSMPNLLILFNDHLIYTKKYAHLKLPQFQSQLKIWLTIIEYAEALIEVAAKKLWGERGRWFVIFMVQTFKCIMRLLLVHRDRERITKTPPIPPLNREKLSKDVNNDNANGLGYCLKRSRTVVRSVNASGPIHTRIWSPLRPDCEAAGDKEETPFTKRNILLAETLYIVKPMIHLTASITKGNKNWLPWATALILDLASLHLITKEEKHTVFSREEREELARRKISLLLYILRSPFYDNCSRAKIYTLLDSLSNNVPFARFIADPVAKYLPHWQKTYFYMWSH